MSRRGALLACLVSCGGAQHDASAVAPGAVLKTYAPLTIRADAKLPGQAVIVGTDGSGGSTVLHLAPTPIAVAAMAIGALTAIELVVSPSTDGAAHVAGELPGVWPAAFVAANALGKDPTDLAFAAKPHGALDGASALAAAGFVVAATGAPLDPRATLAGMIDPDGTIGPTGALVERFTAALASGKTRLGYPAGMRKVRVPTSDKDVDLVELAHARGAEAIEVSDLGDAYALLAGRPLPRPVPVAEAEMTLEAPTLQALAAMYDQWQHHLATEWAAIVQLDTAGRLPPLLITMRDRTKSDRDAAERLRKRGKLAAAYSKMLAAAALATCTNQTYDVLSKIQAGDVPAAIATLTAIDKLAQTTRAAFDQIGQAQPTTVAGHVAMLAAFETGVRGWGFATVATQAIGAAKTYLESLQGKSRAELGASELADEVVGRIAPTLALVAQASAQTTLATQEIALELGTSAHYTCAVADVLRLATAYQGAADAELDYVDVAMLQPLADKAQLALETARERFAIVEPDFLVASSAAHLPGADGLPYEVKAAWGDHALPWGLLALAASQLAYLDTELVIAKYVGLGMHADPRGGVAIAHEPALAAMLAAADRTARTSARQARIAAGAIPVRAKLAYELATVERDGDVGDRIDALSEYWAASLMSQTAVMLARNASASQ